MIKSTFQKEFKGCIVSIYGDGIEMLKEQGISMINYLLLYDSLKHLNIICSRDSNACHVIFK